MLGKLHDLFLTSNTSLFLFIAFAITGLACGTSGHVYAQSGQDESAVTASQDENPNEEQPTTNPNALSQQQSGQQNVTDVSAIMNQLMTAYPNCGAEFETAVQALAISSPQSASQILSSVSAGSSSSGGGGNGPANACHTSSVGKALAKAVVQINQTNPEAASTITALIAQSGDQNLQTAFLSGTGDQTAATGDGGGQPAGGGGDTAGAGDTTGAVGGGGGGATGTGGGFPSSTGGGGGGVSPSN